MTSPDGSYELYIRDAVGQFKGLRPNQWPISGRRISTKSDSI